MQTGKIVSHEIYLICRNIAADAPDYVSLSTGLQAPFTNNLAVGFGYKRLFGDNASESNLNAQLRC